MFTMVAEWDHDVTPMIGTGGASLNIKVECIYKLKRRRHSMNYLVISPYYPQNFNNLPSSWPTRHHGLKGWTGPYEQLDDHQQYSLTEYFS